MNDVPVGSSVLSGGYIEEAYSCDLYRCCFCRVFHHRCICGINSDWPTDLHGYSNGCSRQDYDVEEEKNDDDEEKEEDDNEEERHVSRRKYERGRCKLWPLFYNIKTC